MRISRAPVGWGALVVALLLVSSRASAEQAPQGYPPCDRTPTEGEVAAAKGAFQAGTGSFNEADYERAITYWEDAYRRDCTAHPLLLNLARAYELNNQKRHAVVALDTFLQRNPDSPQAPQIQRRIDKLNEQIRDEEQQAKSAAPQPPPPAPAPAAPAETTDPLPPVEVDARPGKRPVLPLVVAGAGGAVAIVGGVVFFLAKSDVDDFESTCGDRSCTAEEVIPPDQLPDLSEEQREARVAAFVEDGNSARTRMNVGGAVAIVGLGAVAGGLVWYFVQPREGEADSAGLDRDRPRAPRIAPNVAPGFAGLQLSGRF